MTPAEYVEKMAVNAPAWIANEVMLRAKSGKVIPFVANTPQMMLDEVWDDMITRHLPVRIIVLKGRQEGISTRVQARMLHQLVHEPNFYASTICHDAKSTIAMRSRIMGTMVNNLQSPYDVANKRKFGEFRNGSIVDTMTAGSRSSGRSQTISFVHASEVARWHRKDFGDEQADEVLLSLLQAVPDLEGTTVILESTADGARGAFYDYCQNPPEGWRFVFLPYYTLQEYRIRLTPEETKLNDRLQAAFLAGNTLEINVCCELLRLTIDERGYRLGGGYNGACVPLAALKWRRKYGLAKCKNDPARFAQEYPANPEEAFLSSGRPAFAPSTIALWKKMPTPDIHPVPNTHGNGFFICPPVPGRSYRIGVDVCEGSEIPDDKLDYTVCIIHDPIEKRVVAMYRSQETPRVAAAGMAPMLSSYRVDDDGVVVDMLGPGMALIDRLQDLGVSLWGSKPRKAGFRTTGESRPFIIGYLQDEIRAQGVKHPGFPVIVQELADAQQTRNRVDHTSGKHDDCILAWAMALSPIARASERVEPPPSARQNLLLPGAMFKLDVDLTSDAESKRREFEEWEREND